MEQLKKDLAEAELGSVVTEGTKNAYAKVLEPYITHCAWAQIDPFTEAGVRWYFAKAFTGELRMAGDGPMSVSHIDLWLAALALEAQRRAIPDPYRDGASAAELRQIRTGYGRALDRTRGGPRKACAAVPELLRPMLSAVPPLKPAALRRVALVGLTLIERVALTDLPSLQDTHWVQVGAMEGRLRLPSGAERTIGCSGWITCHHCALNGLQALERADNAPLVATGHSTDALLFRRSALLVKDIRFLQRLFPSADVIGSCAAAPAAQIEALLLHAADQIAFVRNRAVVTIGLQLGLRSMSLERMCRGHVKRDAEGYRLTLIGTRDDPTEKHHRVLRPTKDAAFDAVAALDEWLKVVDALDVLLGPADPLFCPLDNGSLPLTSQASSPGLVRNACAALARRAGGETVFTGQSLRVGFAETASAQGRPLEAIQKALAHKKPSTTAKYVRRSPRRRAGS